MSADVVPFRARRNVEDVATTSTPAVDASAFYTILEAVERDLIPFVIETDNGLLVLAFELLAPVPAPSALTAAMIMRDRFAVDLAFRAWMVDGAGAAGTYRSSPARARR